MRNCIVGRKSRIPMSRGWWRRYVTKIEEATTSWKDTWEHLIRMKFSSWERFRSPEGIHVQIRESKVLTIKRFFSTFFLLIAICHNSPLSLSLTPSPIVLRAWPGNRIIRSESSSSPESWSGRPRANLSPQKRYWKGLGQSWGYY